MQQAYYESCTQSECKLVSVDIIYPNRDIIFYHRLWFMIPGVQQ